MIPCLQVVDRLNLEKEAGSQTLQTHSDNKTPIVFKPIRKIGGSFESSKEDYQRIRHLAARYRLHRTLYMAGYLGLLRERRGPARVCRMAGSADGCFR